MSDSLVKAKKTLCTGLQLGGGLLIGNALVCRLIFPNRGFVDGFFIGCIAAVFAIAIYYAVVLRQLSQNGDGLSE